MSRNRKRSDSWSSRIVGVIRDNSSLGFVYLLMLIAVISLSLAIMNLLPIPVLDGGRLYLTLFYH